MPGNEDQNFIKSSLLKDGFTTDDGTTENCLPLLLPVLNDISLEPNHSSRPDPSITPTAAEDQAAPAQLTGSSVAKVAADTERPKISVGPQHFDILTLIGEGAFGKVLLVRNKLNEKIYAMKVISKKLLKKKNHISYMKSEREILTKANHPFVVPLRFAFQTDKRLFLVMDYLSGGELFFHLRKRGVILEQEVVPYHMVL